MRVSKADATAHHTWERVSGKSPASNSAGYATPGSLIYDSGLFGIGSLDATYHLALSVTVPHSFTWSVQFSDLGGGTAGVELYSPPGAGNNYKDYWLKTGSGWELRESNPANPVNMDFAAKLESKPTGSVPDAGSTAAMTLLGMGVLMLLQGRQLRQRLA